MPRIARTSLAGVLLALTCAGCASIADWGYRAHPSQWWKMNRQPAWDEGQFSVPDPPLTGCESLLGDAASIPDSTDAGSHRHAGPGFTPNL